MNVLYKSEHGNYSYHIKEKDDKDILFLESRYEVYSQKIDRLYINKNNLETFGKEELLITPRKSFSSSTGNMDISNDINRLSYYEEPNIYIFTILIQRIGTMLTVSIYYGRMLYILSFHRMRDIYFMQ